MCRILLLLITLSISILSYGQDDSTKTVELENITVSGNRLSIPFDESSRNITVLKDRKIKNLPAESIPGILAYVPGVDIRQRGPVGVQADIGIRGGSFEQTLVLVNGMKLTDPQTGHHLLNLPFNFNNIARIEVLKGPGARIYGQNAFSGAVNFVTKIPGTRYTGIRVYGGQYGLYGGTADLSLPGKKYSQYISLSRDASNGYRHNTDFGINNIFYQSGLSLGKGTLEIIGGFTGRNFGANGFYASPDYTEQYEEVRTSLLSVGLKQKFGTVRISPRIYWRRNQDDYFFVRDNPDAYENRHVTDVSAVELNGRWTNSLGQTGVGFEFRHEDIRGDWVRSGEKTKSNLDGFYRNNIGSFIEQYFNFGKWSLTPGIYINHYSDFGLSAFPGMDVGFEISRALRLYGNIGKSYRIPTFYDMYYQSPVEMGNPDLKPEKALSYELGFRYNKNGVRAEANWFLQNANKLIDWVREPVNDSTYIWHAMNFTDLNRNGIEIAANFDMNKLMDHNQWLNDITISYNFINSDLQEKDMVSRYALENLRHQLIVGIQHRILWQIYHEFKIRFNQRENENPYWLVDSRIFWNGSRGQIAFIEVTNLTDTEYTEVMTPMPGRWIRAGISYKFNLR